MARDITGFIREMLFRHDCVIIPGFGAFIGNYFPARIDRKEGLFEPPSRKITFNRHLTGNDGLLIGQISSGLGVGYGEARDIVLEWADELRRKILTGNSVPMDHLGTFSLNYEGAIIFDPDTTVNYLLTSYGLSAYHRQPVTGFDVRKRALDRRSEPSVSQPTVRSLLTRAAVIIPILVALALVPFNDHLFKGNLEESTLNPLARAELEFNREQIDAGRTAIITGDTLVEAAVPAGPPGTAETSATGLPVADRPVVSAPVASEPPALTSPISSERPAETAPAVREIPVRQNITRPSQAVVVEEYRYLLITGSFKGEDNALNMVERLRRQGFDPEVAGGPDGFLRVSAQSYATLDEARMALQKAGRDFPGAWVCKSRQ
ncbi:MAG: SPOR domain-containing protein [Bacteroidales bacterium]